MAVTTRMAKASPGKPTKENDPSLVKNNAKKEEAPKADEIVFLVEGDTAKSAIVKTGISDDSHIEITEGLTEGQEIIAGGYAAVSRLLEDGKKIKKEAQPEKPKVER